MKNNPILDQISVETERLKEYEQLCQLYGVKPDPMVINIAQYTIKTLKQVYQQVLKSD